MAIFNPSPYPAPVPATRTATANYECNDCEDKFRTDDIASDHAFHTGHCVHDNTEDASTGDPCNGFCARWDH